MNVAYNCKYGVHLVQNDECSSWNGGVESQPAANKAPRRDGDIGSMVYFSFVYRLCCHDRGKEAHATSTAGIGRFG